jgi:hypothetical protein
MSKKVEPKKRRRFEDLEAVGAEIDWDAVEEAWAAELARMYDPSGLRRREGELVVGPDTAWWIL